jgi:hypothetical protein
MVENTRQRLIELKHSQKTVDRSYNSLQVIEMQQTLSQQNHFIFFLDSIQ